MLDPEDMHNQIIELREDLDKTRKYLINLTEWLLGELSADAALRLAEIIKENNPEPLTPTKEE